MKIDKETKNLILDFKDIIIVVLIIVIIGMVIFIFKNNIIHKNNTIIEQDNSDNITIIYDSSMEQEITQIETSEIKQTETTTSKIETTTMKSTTRAVQNAVKQTTTKVSPISQTNNIVPSVSNQNMMGWVQNNNRWSYYTSYGVLAVNQMLTIDGYTYYFDSAGLMVVSNWVNINNEWYYFDVNGRLLTNTTTPDGYLVDSRGRLVEDGVSDNLSNNGPGSNNSSNRISNNAPGVNTSNNSVSYSGPGGSSNGTNTNSINTNTAGTTYKISSNYTITGTYKTSNKHSASINIKLPLLSSSSGTANTKFNNYIKSLKSEMLNYIYTELEDNDDDDNYITSYKASNCKISEQDSDYIEITTTVLAKYKDNSTADILVIISYEKDTGAISYELGIQ